MADTIPRRGAAAEREEISAHLAEQRPERAIEFKEGPGRVPTGPAPGWRGRQRRQKSCERCEGDLWIEDESGAPVPCPCRAERAAGRARTRMRAGDWWHGTSLSFAAPPLSTVIPRARGASEGLIADLLSGRPTQSLWLVGPAGQGKSALCGYLAQRLYPADAAVAQRLGDLLAHLRWLGAVKGEAAVEQRLAKLATTPLLVLDDVDRPSRSFAGNVPLGMRDSCASHDLLRLAQLLRERHDAELPVVLTSRAQPEKCAERCSAVRCGDLVRSLLAIAAGSADPFEDFPAYTGDLLRGAFAAIGRDCRELMLEAPAYSKAA